MMAHEVICFLTMLKYISLFCRYARPFMPALVVFVKGESVVVDRGCGLTLSSLFSIEAERAFQY